MNRHTTTESPTARTQAWILPRRHPTEEENTILGICFMAFENEAGVVLARSYKHAHTFAEVDKSINIHTTTTTTTNSVTTDHAEALEVVARGGGVHHLHGATGQPKGHRPQGAFPCPVHQVVDLGNNEL